MTSAHDAASHAPPDFTPYDSRRVVLLGGTGFIGRWVGRVLTEAGAQLVLPVRDMAVAAAIFADYDVRGDVRPCDLEGPDLDQLLAETRPAVTFNLAGYGVRRGQTDAAKAAWANERLPARLAQGLAEGLAQGTYRYADTTWAGTRLVHVGSQAEYGDGPMVEDRIGKPATLYGETKLAGTLAVQAIATEESLPSVIARVFNVYGPGEQSGRLLPTLIDAASRSGEPIPLTSGVQERDFAFVEDVALGLVRLGLSDAGYGTVVNVATGRLTPVRDFVLEAARLLRLPVSRLRFGELPERLDETPRPEVSIERLRALTGWAPSTPLSDGIRRTVEHVRHLSLEANVDD